MKFHGLKKVHEGKFRATYDLYYETEDGQPKTYEMITRDHNMQTLGDVHNPHIDSVILIITDPSGERILVNHEYRMSMGRWVYNFPAGLIDPGETPEQSAERELREETGLTLLHVDDILGESYNAVGFSNEKSVCILGTADGTFQKSSSTLEEIDAHWYTREEIRSLLKTEPFAARTQAWLYLWSRP